MNARTKAQLRTIVTDLEVMYENELTAQNRHARQGKDSYARHAAWCAEGIQEAITLLQNKFPADAINLLRYIIESSPTDDLQPHKTIEAKPEGANLPSLCQAGNCNHPEHL